VNHLAFSASDLADLARRRERWLAHGCDVMEIDHDWCVSIYTTDPNGTLVEFCTSTRPFDAEDRARALELLQARERPLLVPPKSQAFHKAAVEPLHLRA
jgi:catechol-2,3-dioxygenase